MILSGILIGIFTVAAFILLIEKLPIEIKVFVFGHHLLSDAAATLFALTVLPVNGITALLSVSVFCLTFTLYLHIRRSQIEWKQIKFSRYKLRIITRKDPQ